METTQTTNGKIMKKTKMMFEKFSAGQHFFFDWFFSLSLSVFVFSPPSFRCLLSMWFRMKKLCGTLMSVWASPSISMFFVWFQCYPKMTTEGFWYSFCLFHRFVFQPTKWHTKTCYNTFIAFNSIRFMSLNFWIDVFRWCFSASLLAVANGDALVRLKAKCQRTTSKMT